MFHKQSNDFGISIKPLPDHLKKKISTELLDMQLEMSNSRIEYLTNRVYALERTVKSLENKINNNHEI